MAEGRIIGVAVDGSDNASRAYKWALDNLYREGDTVLAIHCYSTAVSATPGISDPIATSDAFKEEQDRIDKMLYALTSTLTKAGKKGHTIKHQITGKVGEDILKVAVDEKVDFMVMGTRGLGAVKRVFLGSVSDFLVKHAPFPVVIVRESDN